jgi:hypothetical protein
MRKGSEVRQDGLLYIDRDEAVEKHIKALRSMVRPGTIRTGAAPGARPSALQTSSSPKPTRSK